MSHHITRRIINERSDTPIPLSRWSLPRQKPGWRLLVERDLCPFTISSRSYLKLCIAHVEACIVSFLVCSTSDLVLYFIQMYSANIYKWHKWVFHLGHLAVFEEQHIHHKITRIFSDTLFLLRAWLPLMQFSNLYSSVWLKNRSYCCMRWLRE